MRSLFRVEVCEAAGSAPAPRAAERCGCTRDKPEVGGGDFDFLAGNNHLNKDMAGFLLKRGTQTFVPRTHSVILPRANGSIFFAVRRPRLR